MDERRVVVSGLGAITPLGVGKETNWTRLLEGVSGFAPVVSFDPSRHSAQVGAEVRGFEASSYFRRLDPDAVGRASQLAVSAARLALEDAGALEIDLPPERLGVVLGTTSGEPGEVERFNDLESEGALEALGPRFIERYPSHVLAAHVAAEFGFAGPNAMIPAACAAGNYAVGHALDLLQGGQADLVLAGGSDAFSRITYTGFARLGAIAPEVCRPFDRRRRGMIPGEGAAILVLERLGDARARGATIYAEVAGYGLSCDAFHMTAAHAEDRGAARAMAQALRSSGLDASEVSYVSAHGTGTPTNDKLETLAMKRVFGERLSGVPTSSIKSMIGHTMGAASAVESLVCALAVQEDRVPPTMNYGEPDPECALDCVPNQARALEVEVAMNNAYAFGGNNASVIFRKVHP